MTGYQRHIFVCTNKREPDDPRGSCSKLGSEALHACFKQEGRNLFCFVCFYMRTQPVHIIYH